MADKPLGKRIRRDPNVRLAEEEERRSRAQQLASAGTQRVTLPSGIVPNPTRYVPDAKGFCPLSAAELDADLRAVERSGRMAVEEETESDLPQINLLVDKSVKPPVGPESTTAKKKLRFATWLQHPDLLQSEMLKYRKTVAMVNQQYDELIDEDSALVHAMQLSRQELLLGLNTLKEECKKMQLIRNAIGDQILELCNLHGRAEFGSLLKKKAVGTLPRDIIDEISNIHFEYMDQLEKYLAIAAEVTEYANSAARGEMASVAPAKGRKRAHSQTTVHNFEFPVAIIELTADDEANAYRASVNYRTRMTGLQKNDTGVTERVPSSVEKDRSDGAEDVASVRKNRRSRRTDDPAETSEILARLMSTEEQLRFLESTSIGEIVSDQFPLVDPAESPRPLEDCRQLSDSQCMARLMDMFFGSDGGVSGLGAPSRPMKKKPRANGSISIVMTAKPLLTCPRGVPLLVSPAGIYPDRVVGLAANTADGKEGASLSRIPWGKMCADKTSVQTVEQLAEERESNAMRAVTLRSRIVAAEVLLARLTKDVNDWKTTAADVKESLIYTRERHVDTQQYNAADVLSIRARMSGHGVMDVVESNSASRPPSEGGQQRSNGFLKLSSDDDLFGNKSNKNKKSKKSSKQRQPPLKGHLKLESGMDILSSIAGIAADGASELSPTEHITVSHFPDSFEDSVAIATETIHKRSRPHLDHVDVAVEEKQAAGKLLRSRR